MAVLYNNRERLFGMKVTDVSVRSCTHRPLVFVGISRW